MNLETASVNSRTMVESVKHATVPDNQTKVSVEAEVLPEGVSGADEVLPKKTVNAPEDMDAESSAHPELNKFQDAVATADPKGTGDPDSNSSFIPEVIED